MTKEPTKPPPGAIKPPPPPAPPKLDGLPVAALVVNGQPVAELKPHPVPVWAYSRKVYLAFYADGEPVSDHGVPRIFGRREVAEHVERVTRPANAKPGEVKAAYLRLERVE